MCEFCDEHFAEHTHNLDLVIQAEAETQRALGRAPGDGETVAQGMVRLATILLEAVQCEECQKCCDVQEMAMGLATAIQRLVALQQAGLTL